ncbi:MAG: DNA repair protein RecN [Candidatus Polarisedimenticolia bacterium]
MLRCLRVTNLAILRDVTLELGPGLNVMTGETGAGKSILVDALLLAVGGRASAGVIRSGADRAAVSAEFDLEGAPAAAAFLEERGYPAEGESLVVRREILAQGKGRCFLGGALAPLADLKTFGALVVDVHGQHQQQTLLDPARHRVLLDRFAGLDSGLARMSDAFREFQSAALRLGSLREGARQIAQRVDTLTFQIDEIERAAVRPGERQERRAERELLRHAETILRHAGTAYEALYGGDGAALAALGETGRALRELARLDPSLGDARDRLEGARVELQEVALLLRDYPSRLQFEPNRLEAIEERLQLLEALLKKYAASGGEEEVLEHRRRCAAELELLTGGGETAEDLEVRVEELRGRAASIAADLSRARREAAARLEERLQTELHDLAMPRTRFAADVRPRVGPGGGVWVEGEEVAVDAAGYDVVEFLLSANRGEALAPLQSVASGGELSRLMLALEVVLRQDSPARTLVFDEVDAGIGGAVAEAVGRRLQALARRHQVLCVTHLPQIASCADRHVLVSKRAARGRTEVVLETLDGRGQVEELARMLAGATVTEAALRHAAEMRARGGAPREAGR